MILKLEPKLAQTLLSYMKVYSETLLACNQNIKAVEMSKIIAKSEIIKDTYLNDHVSIGLREYLVFSETSLGYSCSKP